MSTLAWLAGGFAVGWGLKKFFGAAPVSGKGSSVPSTVSIQISGMFTILGRPTYVHAPAGANRLLVYFHGHSNSAASRGPRLAAALGDVPVALVVPQLGPKSEPGDLTTKMVEYLSAVKKLLNFSPIHTDGISHSGGYHALAALIRQTNVSGVGLLDSLYGEYETFSRGGFYCLIDIYGSETTKLSEELKVEKKLDPRFQISRTSVLHDSMPERYIRPMAQAFPHCGKVLVVP